MIIHLIAPVDGLVENIDTLRAVVKYAKSQGHEFARDWLEEAYKQETSKTTTDNEAVWQDIIQKNFEAIAKSDVVIADITYDNTAIGYQIATAIHQKKPVLLILKNGSKVSPFTWNIPSNFLKRVEYSSGDIEGKIEPFLKENDITTKDMRFNFFIDRAIYNYLRWAALKTGKTKAEVLRELVNREIDNKDQY
jgi:nucleoside 2-deoxyribosyltransferase